VISAVIKEKRLGPEFSVKRLTLEAELVTYRAAAGLPTTLEDAQRLAREQVDAIPEPRRRRDRVGSGLGWRQVHRDRSGDGARHRCRPRCRRRGCV
jgi:hypothetical protein